MRRAGNNNAYAQDNELTWIDWDAADREIIAFTAQVARLRSDHPTFRRLRYFDGKPVERAEGEALPDIVWLSPEGREMTMDDWNAGSNKSIAVFLNGESLRRRDAAGHELTDDDMILCFNAHSAPVEFTLPKRALPLRWEVILDTAVPTFTQPGPLDATSFTVVDRSLVVLRRMADAATVSW